MNPLRGRAGTAYVNEIRATGGGAPTDVHVAPGLTWLKGDTTVGSLIE